MATKRLIDANALKERAIRVSTTKSMGGKEHCYIKAVGTREIDKAPTVDAVEVVRCKDCKWYQIRQWDNGKPKYDCRKTHALLDVKQDDFCSYGERRTDNG